MEGPELPAGVKGCGGGSRIFLSGASHDFLRFNLFFSNVRFCAEMLCSISPMSNK